MVADTYSTDGVGVLLMGTGNDNNSWGTNANANVFQILVDAICNSLTNAVTGGTLDLSGTPPPSASSQVHHAGLIFTGTLTSNQIVKVPNLAKWWWVNNQTSGAFALTIQTPSPTTTASIFQGAGWLQIYCDGNNNITVLQTIPAGLEVPYAGISVPAGGWYFEYGQAVSRTGDAALLGALSTTCTGNTHSNTTVDGLSTDLRNLGLEGAYIEGTGIATGTTISSINSATSLTLSGAASSTSSGISLRILPWGQGDGSTTFNLPDGRGVVFAGRSNMGGTDNAKLSTVNGSRLSGGGGEQQHTLVTAEVPSLSASVSGTVTVAGTQNILVGGTQTISVTYKRYIPGAGGDFTTVLGGASSNQVTVFNTVGAGSDQTASGSNVLSLSGNNVLSLSGSNSMSGTTTGGGGAHNNVQPTGIRNWIIKR
jgi:microcystin-dependent protein